MKAIETTGKISETGILTLDSVLEEKNRQVKVIILLEEEDNYELSPELENLLDQRLAEGQEKYIPADQSLDQLRKKYGV
ncbi:MAG: hypothetical protein K2Q22_13815 [Cytophagales bacterium]|nr:hypothetical protein [Cytophagales bacterium]